MRIRNAILSVIPLGLAQGQKLDVQHCIGQLTSAPNCDYYASILTICNSLSGPAVASCFCPQTVLNAIAGCENEYLICLEGYEYDTLFTGTSGLYSIWHSACDGRITYSLTTPPITSLSLTWAEANCLSAQSYCSAFRLLTESCKTTSASSLQPCFCEGTILDLASRCEVGGSVSCLFRTPITTNLFSYSYCQADASGPTPTSLPSISVVSTIISVTPPTPTSLTNPLPSQTSPATATSSGSAGIEHVPVRLLQLVTVIVFVAAKPSL